MTARSWDRLRQWFVQHGSAPHVAEKDLSIYEGHSNAFFASCWHIREHESFLMWKAYADKGVAIQNSFERTQASFERTPLAVTGGVVSYVDFVRDQTGLAQRFTHVTTKDLPYESQCGCRPWLWVHERANVTLSKAGGGA